MAAPPPLTRVTPLLNRVRAFTYIAEAYRLLRRRPALLLLPIAVAVFNAVESGVGSYLMLTRTAFGREAGKYPGLDRTAKADGVALLRAELAPGALAYKSAIQASLTFASPIPNPQLTGTQSFARAATAPLSSLFGIILFLAVLPLTAFVFSGYYGSLLEAAASCPQAPLPFRGYVRRWFVRFLWYEAVVYAIVAIAVAIHLIALSADPENSRVVLYSLTPWVPRVFWVVLALTPVAIAADDAPFAAALRRSLRTVVRDRPTTLALLAMLAVACAIPWILRGALAAALSGLPEYPSTPTSALASTGVNAVYHAALALLGVWLCLAQFLWYRDANPIPVVVPDGDEDSSPAVEGG